MESNVQKMRGALLEIDELTNLLDISEDKKNLLVSPSHSFIAVKMRRIIKKALEEPPRNCDMGTAEEQHRRFIEYCNECDCPMGCIHRKEFIGMLDTRCASMLKCYIRWAQMPYEPEEERKGVAE